MAKMVFINDGFVEEEKATLHFKDLSIQRGYGVFDFMRLVRNEPLFLEDHLDRFHLSADGLYLQPPLLRGEIKTIIKELIQRNNLLDTGIRLQLTGGYSADGFTVTKPNFFVSQQSFTRPAKEDLDHGIKLLSYPYQRQLSHIKTIDYLMAIWLQPMLKHKGFTELLYHNDGIITECPRSNFFMVTSRDILVTPAENILDGITRKKLLGPAKTVFEVEERPIHLNELKEAKEAFITSTTKQILPVMQIDEIILPQTTMTMNLLQLFQSRYSC